MVSQQINNLQSFIRTMQAELAQKEMDLRRLKNAQSNLIWDQGEFHRRVNIIQNPELPSNPWRGELAEKFQSFRQVDILSSYKEIAATQLDNALTRLEQEIRALEQSIRYLQGQIAAANASISNLKGRK